MEGEARCPVGGKYKQELKEADRVGSANVAISV
jgi:hypothetical protein